MTLSEKNPGHILIQHNNELRWEIKQMFIDTKAVAVSPNGMNSVTQERNNEDVHKTQYSHSVKKTVFVGVGLEGCDPLQEVANPR